MPPLRGQFHHQAMPSIQYKPSHAHAPKSNNDTFERHTYANLRAPTRVPRASDACSSYVLENHAET